MSAGDADASTALVLAQLSMTALSTVVAFLRWSGPASAPPARDGGRPRLLRWSLDLFVGARWWSRGTWRSTPGRPCPSSSDSVRSRSASR